MAQHESNYATENPIPEQDVIIPQERFDLKVLECEKRKSKAEGRNMIYFLFEICNAGSILQKIEGEEEPVEIKISGIQFPKWVMLEGKTDRESAQRLKEFNNLLFTLGIPEVVSVDEIKPEILVGQIVKAILYTKDEPMKSAVTGEVITNGYDDTPMTSKRIEIKAFSYKRR